MAHYSGGFCCCRTCWPLIQAREQRERERREADRVWGQIDLPTRGDRKDAK